MNKQVNRVLKELNGVSYSDWLKISHAMNRVFAQKKAEQEQQLKLSQKDLDAAEKILADLT